MKEEIEFKGYWFLPDNPHNRIAGILHYIPNKKIKLQLIGSFDTPTEFLNSENERKENHPLIIHGESSNSRKITLIDCTPGENSLNFSCSFPMQSFIPEYVIDGILINSINDNFFNKITLSVPHLTSWMNHYALKYSVSFKEDKPYSFNMGYSLDDAHIISVELNDNITLEMEYVCSPGDKYEEEVLIVQSHQLHIILKNPVALYELLNLTGRFKDFLSLATLEPIDYSALNLFTPTNYQELESGRKVYIPINLLFVQKNVLYKKMKFSDFLFDYEKISSNFSYILKTWYHFDQNMAPIMQHLIDSISPKKYFTKADFLIVIQALEGFHTRFRSKGKVNLQSRLKQLHQEFAFVTSIKKLNIDYKIVVDSRHYYSHFFHKSEKEHIADGIELYHLTASLKKILICCVLRQTGIDDNSIIMIMNSNKTIP